MSSEGAPSDTPPAVEKENSMESSKLEWGPEIGRMTLDDAKVKIAELNANLTEGENPWRLPTQEELLLEFSKTHSTPDGFQRRNYLATGYSDAGVGGRIVNYVQMDNGFPDNNYNIDQEFLVRLVRDTA